MDSVARSGPTLTPVYMLIEDFSTFSIQSRGAWTVCNWIMSTFFTVMSSTPRPRSMRRRGHYRFYHPHRLNSNCLDAALHDVVTAGYVRYIGMSTCRAWQSTSVLSLTLMLCSDIISSHIVLIMQSTLFEEAISRLLTICIWRLRTQPSLDAVRRGGK